MGCFKRLFVEPWLPSRNVAFAFAFVLVPAATLATAAPRRIAPSQPMPLRSTDPAPTADRTDPSETHPPRPRSSAAVSATTEGAASRPVASPPDVDPDTRRRVLGAAGEVFAERGYRAATVREICRRAKANLAAVNYHFGDKATLYSEVLRFAHTCSLERHPPDLGVRSDDPPVSRLRAFVQSFLRRVLDEGRPAWHGRLMCREMAEPTPTTALDDLVRENINVHFARLESIVRELAGPRADREDVRLVAMSTVAQCLYFRFARPVLDRMFPGRYGPADIDRLAAHVVRVTVAAARTRALAAGTPVGPRRRRVAINGGAGGARGAARRGAGR